MTNYQSGHDAEKVAAEYLERQGFEIIMLNWKTKFCEIDIVARRNAAIHFVEVKSRRSAGQGFALEYVTAAKLKQMAFAAEMWIAENNWTGDYQLAAVGIDSNDITYVDLI